MKHTVLERIEARINDSDREALHAAADALDELGRAMEFFDKVQMASEDERIAVSRDHWDWLESAARKVVESQRAVEHLQT